MQEVDSNGRGAAPRARTAVRRGCCLALAVALSLAANASPAATLTGPGELIIEPAGATFALDLAVSGDLYVDFAGHGAADITLLGQDAVIFDSINFAWPHGDAALGATSDAAPVVVNGDALLRGTERWHDGSLALSAGGTLFVRGFAGNAGTLRVSSPHAVVLRDSALISSALRGTGSLRLDTYYLAFPGENGGPVDPASIGPHNALVNAGAGGSSGLTLTSGPRAAGGSSPGAMTWGHTSSFTGIISSGNLQLGSPRLIGGPDMTVHASSPLVFTEHGGITVLAPTPFPAAVPLPAAAPLLAASLVGFGCAARRRLRSAAPRRP